MKIYESFWKKLQDSARKGKIQKCPDLSDLTAQNLLQPSWCSQNSLWLWNYQRWGSTRVGQFMQFAWMVGFLCSQWCCTKRGGTKSLTCLWSLKRSLIMLQGETTFMTLWRSVKIQQLLQWLTASQLEFQVGWDQSIGLRPYHHPLVSG